MSESESPYECPICSEVREFESTLRIHLDSEHSDEPGQSAFASMVNEDIGGERA